MRFLKRRAGDTSPSLDGQVKSHTPLSLEGVTYALEGLLLLFTHKGWQAGHPTPESYNNAACIIERIILRYFKIAPGGTFGHNEVFQQRKGFIPVV